MSLPTSARRVLAGLAVTGLVATGTSLIEVSPAAAATAPGSIVYVKDYNVWLADGDGGQARQVTTGGTAGDPWQSPTQSDAGVVVAHHSGLIYRMNQRGELFNVIDPPDLVDTPGNRLTGRDLQDTAISPDGNRIAYSYFKIWGGERRWTTGFTAATGATDPDQWGMEFYGMPSWVTNDRVVLNHWYRNKTHLYDLGQRDIYWFDEGSYTSDRKELSDLEVSRDGAWTVAARGDEGAQSIIVLHNNGNVLTSTAPPAPDFACLLGPADYDDLREPTLAPDGSTVAWAEDDGIWRVSISDCDDGIDTQSLFIPGGSDPSWSAATVGVTPDAPKGGPNTDDGGKKGGKNGQEGPNGSFSASKAPKLKGVAKVGKVLKATRGTWSPKPAKIAFQWLRGGKPIKKAKKASYRVVRKDRGKRLAVRITVSKPGLTSTTWTSKPVRVKR